MYDINLYPLQFKKGKPVIGSSGFLAVAPPRRVARSRSEDLLILSLSFSEPDSIPSSLQQTWLSQLSQIYFKTSGSVTSALRGLIETLNLNLMEENLKSAQGGRAVIAAVTLAALHNRNLYLVQSGQIHAYVLNQQGVQHHSDISGTDRGLGVSRTPSIRYYQDDVGRGAYFFATDNPPESWADDLLFSGSMPEFEQLRRRLLNQTPANFRVDLAQIKPGEGKINLKQALPQTAEGQSPPQPVQPFDTNQPASEPLQEKVKEPEDSAHAKPNGIQEEPSTEQHGRGLDNRDRGDTSQPLAAPAEEQSQRPMTHLRATVEPDPAVPAPGEHPPKDSAADAREKLRRQKADLEQKGLKGLEAGIKWWRTARMNVGEFFKGFFARWSPEGMQGTPELSKSTLIIIAIAVPLVVVGIAAGVYLGRGRVLQYTQYYNQASAYAGAAAAMDDPGTSRQAWAQSLEYLDQAESYRKTDESAQLRYQVQSALDLLDGAVRLMYHPALTGELYSGIEITRIVSYGADLYLLDEAGGRVIHAERKSQGYTVDPDFICAAGSFEGGVVGELVDMVALPINNPYQAHVMAVDANGGVAYCAAGQELVATVLPRPEGSAGEIVAITYDSGYLYALNPTADSIRVYQAINGQFQDPPRDFFGGEAASEKPDISQIVDLAANGPELYLLQSDGMLNNCVSTGLEGNPVNCENPVVYTDGRPGSEDQPLAMPEAAYTSVLYTTPPDPSVTVLDSTNADIYQFSLRFRLYRRLRPELGAYEVDDLRATAFTIAVDRIAFLAFGHQLFYAYVE